MKLLPFKLTIVFSAIFCLNSQAQQETIDTAVFNKIKKAEFSSSQIPQLAFYLTDICGPRLSNSPGYQRASQWAVNTMKKWGLANASLETWGEFGRQWEIRDFNMHMTDPYSQLIAGYPDPWGANTDGPLKGEVIMLTPEQSSDTTYIKTTCRYIEGKVFA
jgi:carboxypeptidase Q